MGRGWRATADTLHRKMVGRLMADRLNGATPFVRLTLHRRSIPRRWLIGTEVSSLPIHVFVLSFFFPFGYGCQVVLQI